MSISEIAAYWDGRPCNIRHSEKEVGTRDFFLEVSQRKYFVEPHISDFAQFANYSGKRVLEIGCGIGTAMQSFSESKAIYTGVDLSHNSIELGKKRVTNFDLKEVTLLLADVEKLSTIIPLIKYDLIYSFGVLHHTPDIKRALEEIKNFASPGTLIKIMLYNKYSTKSLSLWLKYGWRVRFSFNAAVAIQSEAEFGCPIANVYTKKDVLKLASSAGFQIIKIYKSHIFPYSIKKYIRYEYKYRWYWRIVPKIIFTKLEALFGWHLLIVGAYE
jgi:ubiquinone/menaquinone biosynthesis C-methylase UbiE